ncbi:diamine N-acetyltransferase [Tistlia consotensis]|uniref:Diamine N-acetyltransferase n=1 Tax=Tistlia consotensis USBA 355 TaxID=560819 RepID=A0A1Y6BAZ6_9PROT|nr:GNAT family N-acetyltransferase [Tistlia consotensis]SME93876.1 diamine N-acetyltransferase [Tistlia consotensis USBA 355]SNR28896.1 diamine N-acetyltransferase [Tistlia consotensis]
MPLVIRAARPEDAGTIVGFCRALSAHEGLELPGLDEERFRNDGFGPDAAFATLLAELDGRAAGYVLHCPIYDTGDGMRGRYIADLFVAEWARRRGVGRALLQAAARSAAAGDGRYLVWTAMRGNRAARAFYDSLAEGLEDLVVYWTDAAAFARLKAG